MAIISTLAPLPSVQVMVPTDDRVGLLFHCELAFSVPCELNDELGRLRSDQLDADLSCRRWSGCCRLRETRMSISCDNWLMAASRWSISVAAVGSVGFIP